MVASYPYPIICNYCRIGRVALIVLLGFGAPIALLADPFFETVDVYKPGEDGYAFYHIPGLVVTAKGTVLAYCEGRKTGRSDWEDMDVVLRRSTDGGRSWESQRILSGRTGPVPRNTLAFLPKQGIAGEITYGSPSAIATRDGTVHIFYQREFDHCFYRRSEDDGVTFSAPVDITYVFQKFKPEYNWGTLSPGPAHGVELSNGRLILPFWMATGTLPGGRGFEPSVVAVIYSDDHGRTWQRGDIAVANTPDWPNPNCPAVVQLADGRVMLNVRSWTKAHRRVVTVSPDGATAWSHPDYDPALLEPMCEAGLVRYSLAGAHDGRNRILFSNPDNLANVGRPEVPGQQRDRKNLTVKLSYDETRTWPVHRVLDHGPSGYSDLGVLPDGTILCLYDHGAVLHHSSQISLCLARFNLEWLTHGKDTNP